MSSTCWPNAHSHHQYAQAGDAPTPPAPIATVKALIGSVSAVRNGAEITLKIGDPIYKSDIIQTASGSSVGITFPDGTALHITANARMALSDYSFDANSTTNGAFFHLIDGTFSFVAGQVARTGGLKIETPVGTVGIRGTTGWVQQVATVSATARQHLVFVRGGPGSEQRSHRHLRCARQQRQCHRNDFPAGRPHDDFGAGRRTAAPGDHAAVDRCAARLRAADHPGGVQSGLRAHPPARPRP